MACRRSGVRIPLAPPHFSDPCSRESAEPRAKAIGSGAFLIFGAEDAVHHGRLTPDRGGACTWTSHWLEWLPPRRSRGYSACPLKFTDDSSPTTRAQGGVRGAEVAQPPRPDTSCAMHDHRCLAHVCRRSLSVMLRTLRLLRIMRLRGGDGHAYTQYRLDQPGGR
jgi:hypothetical protein